MTLKLYSDRPAFTGVIPPLVTPLKARDELDQEGLSRLLEHTIAGGVTGVFILGTTGEAPSLSYRLRRELITQTVKQVNGRVPVLVGVADTCFTETVELATFAANAGVDAAVLTTPYYFPAGQTELTRYIQNIVPEIPLPVMLYNMPGMTKVVIEIETLQKVIDINSIIGVKDSGGDLNYFAQVCQLKQQRPDWSVMIGPEALMPRALQLGGDGCVAGGANVMPSVFVDCYHALTQHNFSLADQHQQQILTFQKIYEIGKYASKYIKATKSALSLLGICQDLPADPFNRFLEPQRQQVAEILETLGLIEQTSV